MFQILTDWLSVNYVELLGALLGLAYIILSIRQNILTWPTGMATSLLYVVVFFHSRFYAGMGLQIYYVIMSLYGWYYWLKGKRPEKSEELPVGRINSRQIAVSAVVFLVCFAILYLFLSKYTDSPVPVLDSMTTSLSIVATWMLARKILENWLLWVVTDLISTGLYIYKSLWPTTGLFLVYTGLAVYGYYQWKRTLSKPA
jgi:nicotinamide mononucleotide transporter